MDIETFYEQNEARRESAEVELGDEWTDAHGNHYELSWVEATGELYLMVEPEPPVATDLFGDFYVGEEPASELSVVVIGVEATRPALEDALAGWQGAINEDNSLAWLYARFPPGGRPGEDM